MVGEPKTHREKMKEIINQNVIRTEIRRVVKEELQKEIPNGQLNSLWGFLNKLDERIKILENE